MAVTILGICGSLRTSSINRALLDLLVAGRPSFVELSPWNDLAAIPPFDEDEEAEPGPAVLGLRTALRSAGAVFIATPEYNGGMPGQLKNALDWASRPRDETPLKSLSVGVIGASPGRGGGAGGVDDVRRVLTHIGADVIDGSVTVPYVNKVVDADGSITDPAILEQLRSYGARVGHAMARRHHHD